MSLKVHSKTDEQLGFGQNTLEVSGTGDSVSLTIFERYGGEDEGPIYASIDLSLETWAHSKNYIRDEQLMKRMEEYGARNRTSKKVS